MGTAAQRILVVEDTRLLLRMCKTWLEKRDYEVVTATTGDEALAAIEQSRPSIALIDLGLPDMNGLDLLSEIKHLDETIEVIVMTGRDTVENAVTAMRLGACDFISKPVDFDALERSFAIADRSARISGENRRLRSIVEESGDLSGLIGEAPGMQDLKRLLRKVAPTEEVVLVTGENGTGKEVVARAIHSNSQRQDGPFIAVNCGAIAETLIESELFGHLKGSFSGADRARLGWFRQAEGGTLFLDEIGEMAPAMQVKLLRALENRAIIPVGADQAVPIDIRIVAATNVNLLKAVEDGSFREDLYYRLNVFHLEIPPLRERTGDISLLADGLLAKLDAENPLQLSPTALAVLETWPWPGNVRELGNALRRAAVLAETVIEAEHLPPRMLQQEENPFEEAESVQIPVMNLEELERKAVQNALAAVGGDRARAAQALGIDRTTLYRKLKRWGEDGQMPDEIGVVPTDQFRKTK